MEEAFGEGQGPHRAVEPVMMMKAMDFPELNAASENRSIANKFPTLN
jgi:hypothetical protein